MRLSYPPARSFYASGQPAPARDSLRETIEVDVCVLGGGIAGCSTALHLAQRGYRVALLEARTVGYGASGRSGGQTIFGLAVGQQRLERDVGREDAHRLFALSIEALDLTQTLIRDHAIDCDYHPNHVHVAVKARHVEELKQWCRELNEDYAYHSVKMLDRDELQDHVRTPRYLAGLLDTRSGHLNPLKFTNGLARAAETAGVSIYENSQVLRYEEGSAVRVHTATGAVRCANLILCGNAYIGNIAPQLSRRILGVGTYIIATEPLGERLAGSLLPSNAAIADINWILDYFRRSEDNRLLFGGRVSYSSVQPPRLADSMLSRMRRVFPALDSTKVAYAWGGYLDITMSRAPNFGRLSHNVFYAQGFSGHGMALSGLAGKLAAEAVAGTAERFDVFARIPHRDFPGGTLFRRPSLMLAMLYLRMRDIM